MSPALLLLAVAAVAAQETVSFPTADGATVFADRYGDGPHAVVLAPGARFTKESWKDQAPALVEAGFQVLALDFRGRGQSRAPEGAAEALHLDVLAAVRYLRQRGATLVAVVGASLGGWAAARAAIAAPGTIDRLVLLAAAPVADPKHLPRTLFVTARDDRDGRGTLRLKAISEQYRLAPEPRELLVLEGSAHAQFLFATDQGPRLLEEIIRFLSDP